MWNIRQHPARRILSRLISLCIRNRLRQCDSVGGIDTAAHDAARKELLPFVVRIIDKLFALHLLKIHKIAHQAQKQPQKRVGYYRKFPVFCILFFLSVFMKKFPHLRQILFFFVLAVLHFFFHLLPPHPAV